MVKGSEVFLDLQSTQNNGPYTCNFRYSAYYYGFICRARLAFVDWVSWNLLWTLNHLEAHGTSKGPPFKGR